MLLFWMRTAKIHDFFLNINVFGSSFLAFCAFILLIYLNRLFASDTFSIVLFREKRLHKINEIKSIASCSIDSLTFSHNECFALFRVKSLPIKNRWVRRMQRSTFSWKKIVLHNFLLFQKISQLKYMHFTTAPGKLRHYEEWNKHQMFAMRWNWAIKWLKVGENNKYTCVYYYFDDFRWDFPS